MKLRPIKKLLEELNAYSTMFPFDLIIKQIEKEPIIVDPEDVAAFVYSPNVLMNGDVSGDTDAFTCYPFRAYPVECYSAGQPVRIRWNISKVHDE